MKYIIELIEDDELMKEIDERMYAKRYLLDETYVDWFWGPERDKIERDKERLDEKKIQAIERHIGIFKNIP